MTRLRLGFFQGPDPEIWSGELPETLLSGDRCAATRLFSWLGGLTAEKDLIFC